MDSIFLLGEADRAAFLQHLMQSFGCSYICLWSYLPQPSNCLIFLDGLYREHSNQQASSSSGSLARRLFNAYRESVNYVDHGRVPGFAFKNNLPYMELKLHDLQRLASSEVQMQVYQEAGIKTVVFMGCATGEIELGISSDPLIDMEMEMKNWFPDDFSRQTSPGELPQPANQNLSSTSSSSIMSLSVDSIDYSPGLFNIPSTSFIPVNLITSTSSQQQAINPLSQIRNNQFPSIESENAAMTSAILAVLSRSPSTSSSSNQTAQNVPHISPVIISHKPAAFRSYRSALAPVAARPHQRHNMFKRAVSFLTNVNMRRQELQLQGNQPTSTQLHHVMSERRRRERLNESFQILRSILPPGSKKDKASVLSSTTEYLSSLKSQMAELSKRNQILETQVLAQREATEEAVAVGSSNERLNVNIAHVSSSTSEARFLDLRVILRGEYSMLDLVIRVLEFLKLQRNVALSSVESNTSMVESAPLHRLVFRLKVEGDEFDESGFQEAVRRVVDDHLAH